MPPGIAWVLEKYHIKLGFLALWMVLARCLVEILFKVGLCMVWLRGLCIAWILALYLNKIGLGMVMELNKHARCVAWILVHFLNTIGLSTTA